MKSLLFVLLNVLNYSLIIISVFGYRLSGILFLIFLIAHALFAVANAKVARTEKQWKVLTANLLISTIIAHPIWMVLLIINDHQSNEGFAVIPIVVVIGCAIAVAFSHLAFHHIKDNEAS